MAVNLTDVQTDLAYLLGEQSAPSTSNSEYAVRSTFIQRALERAYRAYDFPMNKISTSVTAVAGIATLASVLPDSVLDVRVVVAGADNDYEYREIDYEEQDSVDSSDYAYYRTFTSDGTILLNLSQDSPTLTVRHTTAVPTINASVASPFPSSMALARGALIYYRQAEDPQADIGQEEALFQGEISEIIAQYNRSRPQRRMKDRHEDFGSYIGNIGGE